MSQKKVKNTTSILEKLSTAKFSEAPIREQLTLKKRGRPRRNPVQILNEILPTHEPEPIEAKTETPVLVEEQVQEPKSLAASDNSELIKTVTEQPVTNVASNPKLNFLQHLLQKLRPVVRP